MYSNKLRSLCLDLYPTPLSVRMPPFLRPWQYADDYAHACAHAACPCICSCVMPNACFHADALAISNIYVYKSHRHLLRIICWPFVITYYLLVISHYLSILSYLANASEVGG